MYPDPITPRAHPDLLAREDYDPFHVMPAVIPPAPRVFTTAAHLQRARQRLAGGSAQDRSCLERLIALCALDKPLPELKPANDHPDWGGPLVPWLSAAFHNALAWSLTGEPGYRQRALEALRLAARACTSITSWTGHEHHEAVNAARAYDLLAASGLDQTDDQSFRAMLEILVAAMDQATHRACNNHNSMQMWGRLSLAAALGNRAYIHDTLYGCARGGPWRYGLIHLLRHDFLADGMQWEGSVGYHMLVLMMVCECFTILENMGQDLWRRTWPALRQDDGFDEHRGWGPKADKSLPAAFDALLYQAFGNGDYCLLHDQGLGNLRGTLTWWPLFNKAYAVFRDPRYAWALRHINGGKPATADGPLPAWLAGDAGAAGFVRVEDRAYPAGEHPLARDREFSITGRHVSGCSLFPMHGSAVLRSNPQDPDAPGAYLYWGPHWAGHRAPAALHLDIHARGRRLATAPHHFGVGYTDSKYRTWNRATLAHNTVTVDQQSMFPYDFPSESLWECDHWRDTLSDGALVSFQPGRRFKAVRASNDNVYAGVTLDRTVVLSRRLLLDVYRVTARQPRLLDWAMHACGEFALPEPGEPVELGSEFGYRHLSAARLHPQRSGWVALPFRLAGAEASVSMWLDGAPGARLIMARDPEPDDKKPIGEPDPTLPTTCLIVRSQAASALFVSAWSLDGSPLEGGAVQGTAEGDVTVALRLGGKSQRWLMPFQGDVRALRQLAR